METLNQFMNRRMRCKNCNKSLRRLQPMTTVYDIDDEKYLCCHDCIDKLESKLRVLRVTMYYRDVPIYMKNLKYYHGWSPHCKVESLDVAKKCIDEKIAQTERFKEVFKQMCEKGDMTEEEDKIYNNAQKKFYNNGLMTYKEWERNTK